MLPSMDACGCFVDAGDLEVCSFRHAFEREVAPVAVLPVVTSCPSLHVPHQSKVAQLEQARGRHVHVLWLDVIVSDALRMQECQALQYPNGDGFDAFDSGFGPAG